MRGNTARRRLPLLAAFLLLAGPSAFAAPAPEAGTSAGPDGHVLFLLPPPSWSAPPVVDLATPVDGAGANGTVVLSGIVTDRDSSLDVVEYRVDRGAWAPVAVAARSTPLALAWEHAFDTRVLPPGEHLVEVRAFDGAEHSLPAPARFTTADGGTPPSLEIARPRDGDGLAAGAVDVRGVASDADGLVHRVEVRIGNGTWSTASLGSGGAWDWTGHVLAGEHTLEARAFDANGAASVVRRVTFAAGASPPPRVEVLTPAPRAGFADGEAVRIAGVVHGEAVDVLVSVDGGPARSVAAARELSQTRAGGSWSHTWPTQLGLGGPHRAEVRAVGPDGAVGAPARLEFALGAPRRVQVVAEPATPSSGDPVALRLASTGELVSARWRIDGASAGEALATSAVFASPGPHEVEADVVDANGRTGLARAVLFVRNRAPVVEAFVDAPLMQAARLIRFDASATRDVDGSVTAWRYDFGDGTVTPWIGRSSVEHSYARKGTYAARVFARDDRGAVGDARLPVVILNSPPKVTAFADPAEPSTFEPVRFTARTYDADGDAVVVRWELGDGLATDAVAPVHAFTKRGPVVARALAFDVEGAYAASEVVVNVANVPPVAAFAVDPPRPTAGAVVRFVDESTKRDGDVVAWRWDLGDGNESAERVVYHAFPREGSYLVRLEVEDDHGDVSVAERVVTVGNGIPDADFSWEPRAPTIGDEVRFRSLAGDVDGRVVETWWDFGDGSPPVPGDTASRTFRAKGVHPVTIRVVDDDGARSSLTRDVTVVNAPPTASTSPRIEAIAGEPVVLHATAGDRDGRIVEHAWDVDGDGVDDVRGDGPRIAWIYPAPGRFLARFTAVDDDAASVSKTVEVLVSAPQPADRPPVAFVFSPANGSVVEDVVRVEGAANDDRRVERVEWQVRQDGWVVYPVDGSWLVARGGATWAADLDTRLLGNGRFEVLARAVDARTEGDPVSVTLDVANDPRETASIALHVLDPAPGADVSGIVSVRGTAWHRDGLDTVLVAVDEGELVPAEGTYAWSRDLDLREASGGRHTLRVQAWRGDALYREERLAFHLNNDPPILDVDHPPAVANGTFEVTGHTAVLPPAARVLVAIDGGEPTPASGTLRFRFPVDTTLLADGVHEVAVTAVGVDGIASAPVTHSFVVRNAAPAPPPPTVEEELESPGAGVALLAAAAALVALARGRRRA